MKVDVLRIVQTSHDHGFGSGRSSRQAYYVEFSVLGEVVRAHVNAKIYAKLKAAGVVHEELVHNKRVRGGTIGAVDEFERSCTCGDVDGEHARNGRGPGPTFCLREDCDCEEFRWVGEPKNKIARIDGALHDTRAKLKLLRGGRTQR